MPLIIFTLCTDATNTLAARTHFLEYVHVRGNVLSQRCKMLSHHGLVPNCLPTNYGHSSDYNPGLVNPMCHDAIREVLPEGEKSKTKKH